MSETSPATRIAAECARRGRREVVADCAKVLSGEEPEPSFLVVLGDEHARRVLDGYDGGLDGYWPRVWAARGLLHAGIDGAEPELARALSDPAWRVREMAAKALARHGAASCADQLVARLSDPVERVRAAADRALSRLGGSEAS